MTLLNFNTSDNTGNISNSTFGRLHWIVKWGTVWSFWPKFFPTFSCFFCWNWCYRFINFHIEMSKNKINFCHGIPWSQLTWACWWWYKIVQDLQERNQDKLFFQNDMAKLLMVDEIRQWLDQYVSLDWIWMDQESFSHRIECSRLLSRPYHHDWMNNRWRW